MFQIFKKSTFIVILLRNNKKKNWFVNWSISVFCLHYFNNSLASTDYTSFTTSGYGNQKSNIYCILNLTPPKWYIFWIK